MTSWRAGCGESRTSGSEGGLGKRTRSNPDTAPQVDPTTSTRGAGTATPTWPTCGCCAPTTTTGSTTPGTATPGAPPAPSASTDAHSLGLHRTAGPFRISRGLSTLGVELDFRAYATMFDQARRRMVTSCGVTGSGPARRNCAVMMTRRSLESMAGTDGWVLCGTTGRARGRRDVVWWCPAVAYQQTARLLIRSSNGAVGSTAAWSRLRAEHAVPRACHHGGLHGARSSQGQVPPHSMPAGSLPTARVESPAETLAPTIPMASRANDCGGVAGCRDPHNASRSPPRLPPRPTPEATRWAPRSTLVPR